MYLSLACGRDLRQVVFVFYLPVTSTACFRDFSLILNDSHSFGPSSHKTRRNKNLNDPVQVLQIFSFAIKIGVGSGAEVIFLISPAMKEKRQKRIEQKGKPWTAIKNSREQLLTQSRL